MVNTEKLKNSNLSYIFGKISVLSFICSKCSSKTENIFEEEESIKYLKKRKEIRQKEID